MGEVRKQPKADCQSLQALVRINQSKSNQAPKEMTERQNWIQDKINFLKTHIRHKGLCKYSAFESLARGASASTALTHNISRGSNDTDSIEISMRSDSFSYKSKCSFPAFLSRPVGHGLVCANENHAVIFSGAKAGDHQNSLLQLPGI